MFDGWWHYARDAYLDLEGDDPPQLVTLYYDPLLDVHHRLPVLLALINTLYLAPQRPDDARRLYDAALGMVGALGDGPPVVIGERLTGIGLLLAREWGIDDTAARLEAGAEATYEPTWHQPRGEHTWGFGLGEEHPRGQYNAIMAAAEAVTPGAWTALAGRPPPALTGEVVGVDFPRVAVRRAAWVDGVLHVTTAAVNEAAAGRPTSWRVTGLDDPSRWRVTGDEGVAVEVRVDGDDLVVDTVVGDIDYRVTAVS